MSVGEGGTQWEPSRLRRLLLGAGVGDRHGYRELARQSGHRLSRTTWSRLVAPIPLGQRGARYAVEDLQAVAETLRRVGERVTLRQLELAVLADLGYALATSSDDLAEWLARLQSLSHHELLRLNQEVALLLAPDGPADASERPRAPVDRADPARG